MELSELDKYARFLEELESLWFPGLKVKTEVKENPLIEDRDEKNQIVKSHAKCLTERQFHLLHRGRAWYE